MNSFITKFFALILSLAMLSACANTEQPSEEPSGVNNVESEIPEGAIWERDAHEHWIASGGKKTNVGEHTFGDDFFCTVCKSEIIDWGDGSFDVYNYDDNYNLLRHTSYDIEGNVTEYINEYEYDENGNPVSSKAYQDGVLISECEYILNSDGTAELSSVTEYFDDGSYCVSDYLEDGDLLSYKVYSPEGELSFETKYEYSLDQEGWSYASRVIEHDFETGYEYEYIYNSHNDIVECYEYDEKKMVVLSEVHEYEYNEDGWKTYHKTILNGLPSEEIVFGIYDDGEGGRWTYYEKHTVYSDDGSYTVSEYNENDELLSETRYDANGNIIK